VYKHELERATSSIRQWHHSRLQAVVLRARQVQLEANARDQHELARRDQLERTTKPILLHNVPLVQVHFVHNEHVRHKH